MRGARRMCKLEKKLKGLGFPGGTSAPAAQQVRSLPSQSWGDCVHCTSHCIKAHACSHVQVDPTPEPGENTRPRPTGLDPRLQNLPLLRPRAPQTQAREPPPWPISQGQTPLQSPRGKGAH